MSASDFQLPRLWLGVLFLPLFLVGCGTTFDGPKSLSGPEAVDESLSWWRTSTRTQEFAALTKPAEPTPVEEIVAIAPPPPKDLFDRLRRGFAIPDLNTARVRQRELWFAQRPELVKRIFVRSTPFVYYIIDELEKRKMPTELALLPFIESGFDPKATSSAQAAGLWQFIPGTATRYRLKMDLTQDERRDVIASTTAALDYLQFLYQIFGDWHLVLASYNWGENSVQRAVDKNKSRNLSASYEHLTLPDETQDYLPKLQAIKNIVNTPGTYGNLLPDLPNRPYIAVTKTPFEIRFADAARYAGIPLEEFMVLNTGYLNDSIPGERTIVLPMERIAEFERRAEASRPQQARRKRAK